MRRDGKLGVSFSSAEHFRKTRPNSVVSWKFFDHLLLFRYSIVIITTREMSSSHQVYARSLQNLGCVALIICHCGIHGAINRVMETNDKPLGQLVLLSCGIATSILEALST